MCEENKNLEENIKRHIDVMLEHMDGRFDVIIESQKITNLKVDSLENKVDSLVEDMDFVKSNLVDKNERFKEVDKVTKDHEKRLVGLENTVPAKA